MGRRTGSVWILAVALSLLFACAATAAIRYAAPGGTGVDPCVNPARPCSIFTAADWEAPRSTLKADDVVELAPGTYHAEIEGEFGYIATVTLPEGVTVRGEPGKARPVIILRDNETGSGAFRVPAESEVADVEIRNRSHHGSAIDIAGGTMERVIARSRVGNTFACELDSGTIRSSACLNSGGGSAIGVATFHVGRTDRIESVIRNSTLVATGPGSVGMDFAYYSGSAHVNAIGVLAKGEAKDVIARALRGDGGAIKGVGEGAAEGITKIELQASNYATIETEASGAGRASVTPPGTNGNIKAPPHLAAGNLHQLPGSPTIDRGAVDGASGPLDVDEQLRTMGTAADIGADELELFPSRINSAPVTELVMPPLWLRPLRTPLRMAEFTFGSSDVGSRFECKLDRKPFRACTSPHRIKVKLGKHAFRVRAVDPQGMADATPAVLRWRVVPWRVFRP